MINAASESLFHRLKKETLALLYLATPIIVAQLSMSGMNFVDTAMSGRASPEDLAAIAIGGSMWVPCFLILRGLMMAITPTIAHHYGARTNYLMATEVKQGLWIALFVSLLTIFFLQNTSGILSMMAVDHSIIPITDGYLKALSYSAPAVAAFIALSCYCEGCSDTRPSMIISVIGLMINIPANYILIYGKFGMPQLGAVGCGWATSLSFYTMALLQFIYVHTHHRHQSAAIFKSFSYPNLRQMLTLLKLGTPIAIALFVEGSIFAIIALLIGKLGAKAVAAHQVALSFSSVAFMIPLSISFGLTIRIGQSLGAARPEQALFRARTGYLVTAVIGCFSAGMMLLFSENIARIYSSDHYVIVHAAHLIIYAAIFQISDALQVCSAGILRGYKDTAFPMLVVIIAYWVIGLPLGYGLGMTDLMVAAPMGAAGFWIGLISGLTVAAIGLGARFFIIFELKRQKALS